ncbi:uncharacterized protein ALTATR162_LOCUS5703 [Alternaria atra]|uniref:Nuclear pore complex component n=1 Tax=Alternaria atra TaxID=119953 RepID=A0A8J2N1X1_9PLEO|nr:uncharacterized protein ALTATR162_LOCUS5703 [Alternaria atra]CAG5159935.1 unnamed protein product [Alternaria atra]
MSVARYAQPATPQTPATPSAQTEQPYTPNGSWRHPKFDEIARRQYATTFDERNVRAIVLNAGFLFLSIYGNTVTEKVKLLEYAATPINAVVKAVPYSHWAILLVRIVFTANIVIAFLPLIRRYYPDEIVDIPLTPSQRASMGLKTGVQAPPTPGSAYASPNYVTPPRYQRSTPRSNSFSAQENGSHSPSPRPNFGRSGSGSPFSPNNGGSFDRSLSGSAIKRMSYGSSMSGSLFGDSSSSMTPGTPTPSTGKASVGLNNKWLYEKRRDSPKSSMFM